MNGTLSIVATPIGNLGDITLRALDTLKAADAIACEDTRVTSKLLARYAIEKPLLIFHARSGRIASERILGLLGEGKHIALVTDAGTPGISDPGSQLVAEVRARLADDVRIESIPARPRLPQRSRSPASERTNSSFSAFFRIRRVGSRFSTK